MLSTVFSSGVMGIDGFEVTVECNMQDKIPCFEIVGLPDAAVKEAENLADIQQIKAFNAEYNVMNDGMAAQRLVKAVIS